MKRFTVVTWSLFLAISMRTAMADEVVPDLRRAVPADAYLITHAKHNPERDFQRPYLERVLETIGETRVIERFVEQIAARMPEHQRDKAETLLDELTAAAAPIELRVLLDTKEAIYAQRMEPFQIHREDGDVATLSTSQHLVLLRLTPDVARDYQRGIQDVFEVLAAHDAGKVAVNNEQHDSITLTTMSPRGKSPYCPTVARVGDVIICSSSCQFARDSLAMLLGKDKPSKFDDPRLVEALRHLPEPEDAVVFFDGREQFGQIREMVDSVHRLAGHEPKVDRWAKFAKTILDEVAILDYLAVVEYTDGHRNFEETLGRLMPDAEHRVLTKMLDAGQPFEDWHRWVPADATGYSLSSGVSFHPVYRRTVDFIREHIPEMHLPLQNFEKWQRQIDLHLDVDLLQSFSGEYVSVTLPAERPSLLGGQDLVWAMRCDQPERVGWLIERLVDHLNTFPLIQVQRLQLVPSEDLDGFHEVSAAVCELFGIRPVFGFEDGWMFVGSNANAVSRVLSTRAGEAESMAESSAFQQFQLAVDGPVRAIRFVNLQQQTRQIADGFKKAGAVMPMVIGFAEASAGTHDVAEALVPLRIMAEMLPRIGRIVEAFDFMEAQLTVIEDGDEPGTWHERRITLIRPAADDTSETSQE